MKGAVVAAVLACAAVCHAASIAHMDRGNRTSGAQRRPRVNEITFNEKGERITPFMRKHGITPSRGWGLRAGELSGACERRGEWR